MGGEKLHIVPLEFKDACAFIWRYHRLFQPPQSHKFTIGLSKTGRIVGVAIVGRPVLPAMDDGRTLQVIRLCTDGTKKAGSKLYAACWDVARAMGYRQIIAYLKDHESPVPLEAAGWRCLGSAGSPDARPLVEPGTEETPTQLAFKYIGEPSI